MSNSSHTGGHGGGTSGGVGGTGQDPGVIREAGGISPGIGQPDQDLFGLFGVICVGRGFSEDSGDGKSEGLEEVEMVLRRHRRKLGTGSKEMEPERHLERGPEVVVEADVEMTLQ